MSAKIKLSLVLVCLFTNFIFAAGGILPGTGSAADPYLIEDINDFDTFSDPNFHDVDYWAQDVYTKLTCDIDLTGREYYKPPIAWYSSYEHPFEYSFNGIFLGNNHKFINLYINAPGKGYRGLFGILSHTAVIQNLGCENDNIFSSSYSGNLCGINYGTISNCYATGSVSGSSNSDYLGGLCGYNNQGTISNCYATSSVSGGDDSYNLGGLCGRNYSGTVTNCYATGSVSGGDSSRYLGGLCGYTSGTVTNCYATGSVSGGDSSHSLGGLCGSNSSGTISKCYAASSVSGGSYSDYLGGLCGSNYSGTVSNCFWDTQTSGFGSVGDDNYGATGLTTTEMQDVNTFLNADWDFVAESANGTCQIWQMPATNGYPLLSSLNGYTPVTLDGDGSQSYPYLISNALELGAIYHYNNSAYYKLTADIELSGIQWSASVIPSFKGHFDGDGHVICNLTISGDRHLGLFGKIDVNAEITNVGLENISIIGLGSYLGGLCGYNDSGTITNCYAAGLVSGGNNSEYLGGLCGYNYSGTISDSYAASSVSGGSYSDYLGGLCGYNNQGTISNCYATGSVSGDDYLGGLCGENYCGTISNCYATGSVSGVEYLGGLCGENNGTISNCYATSSVSGVEYLGGLCGENNGTISKCYAAGSVSGRRYLGGLCGSNNSGTITNCYTTGTVSGNRYLGGLCGENYCGTITNCYTTGTVSGNRYLGGLCGYNKDGTISNCYATGSVSGDDFLGGLCGYNYSGTISDSYAASSVSGGSYSDYLGGLCGYNNQGTISNCYATGSVSGDDYLGGLCGENYCGTISNCYAVGTVSGNSHLGGLCGYQFGNSSEISNSFWDTQTSGMSSSDGGTGLTTAEMQDVSNYLNANWDFVAESANGTEDIWRMPYIMPGYPILSWHRDIPGDHTGSYGVNLADFGYLSKSWQDNYTITDLQTLAQYWLEHESFPIPEPIDPNIVAYWTFDETSGSIACDSSGNLYNGTIHGDPNWLTGKINNCLNFDGTENFVQIESYTGISSNMPRTVATWIKADEDLANTDHDNNMIISWGLPKTNTKYWAFFIDDLTGQLSVDIWGSQLIGGPDLEDGQWHHVAAVLPDGANNINQVLLYIDGVQISTNSSALDAVIDTTLSGNVIIGAFDKDPQEAVYDLDGFFNGSIDDTRINKSALSASDIANLKDLAQYWLKGGGDANSEPDFTPASYRPNT